MKGFSMRYVAAILLCIFFATQVGCGEPRTINGKYQDTVGFVDQMEGNKDPCIKYELSAGNLIWSIVLIETIVAPIYFWGWSLFNPVSAKDTCNL
jgi:hypothetical protein